MKFRRNKIKREHTIIDGALDWLEELSKLKEVKDIIPGVIDVTNSKERGITYQYETSTGCKLLLKNGGSIQEAFVVTENPDVVQFWVNKLMEELNFFQASLDDRQITSKKLKEKLTDKKTVKQSRKNYKSENIETKKTGNLRDLDTGPKFLTGAKEYYQLVEINKGLRDSLLDSFAIMADLENPVIEDSLNQPVKEALEDFKKKLNVAEKNKKKRKK